MSCWSDFWVTLSNIRPYTLVQVHCLKTTCRTGVVDYRASKVQVDRGGKLMSGENIIEAIENTHVTVGINDFLAGRDSNTSSSG